VGLRLSFPGPVVFSQNQDFHAHALKHEAPLSRFLNMLKKLEIKDINLLSRGLDETASVTHNSGETQTCNNFFFSVLLVGRDCWTLAKPSQSV